MDGEEQSSHPGAEAVARKNLPQQPPKENRAQQVEKQVSQMIAKRSLGPKMPLQPLHTRGERKIIRGPDSRPNLFHARPVSQKRIVHDHEAVIPYPTVA